MKGYVFAVVFSCLVVVGASAVSLGLVVTSASVEVPVEFGHNPPEEEKPKVTYIYRPAKPVDDDCPLFSEPPYGNIEDSIQLAHNC